MALFLVLTFVTVSVLAFAAGYAVASRTHRIAPRSGAIEVAPALLPPVIHAGEPDRVAFSMDVAEGTAEWQHAMREVGDQMRRAGVRLVVFAHGSFVGDDPLAVARTLEDAVPLGPELARALRGFTRAQISRLLGDLSNFPREYVDAFARATGIDATDFVWSGENHHAARIQGAVRLARAVVLHGGGSVRLGDRVLLVGHSHGGQLFAILSQLVAQAEGYEEILAAARARGEDVGAFEEHAALLRRCPIDVVTFGTPPRYGWARRAKFRVLHLVNHRGGPATAREHRGPRALLGFLHTRQGDYVHRLGGHGSDFPAPTVTERRVNARLDLLLGEGSSARAWLRELARGRRVSSEGRTILVDYGDAAAVIPNFLATGLGHAAYTRREAMLFHARLVARELYPLPPLPPARTAWHGRLRSWIAKRRSPPARPQLPPAAGA